MNDKDNTWVAPLVRTLLSSVPIQETMGALVCPVCGCDHQIFLGTGVLGPSKAGGIICAAFPTAETIVRVDLPADIKIGGMTLYTRYFCKCGDHSWVHFCAFQDGKTMCWAAEVESTSCSPTKKSKKSKEHSKPTKSLLNATGAEAIGQFLDNLGLSKDAPPVVVLGPGIVQNLTPEDLKKLQGKIKGAATEKAKPADDHESPRNMIKSAMKCAWFNWEVPPGRQCASMPVFPAKKVATNKPPYIGIGVDAAAKVDDYASALFALAVEIGDFKSVVHALLHWDGWLIIITDYPDKSGAMEIVSSTLSKMSTDRHQLWVLGTEEYEVVRKEAKAREPKV